MPHSIAAGTLFALFRRRAGALAGVATVSFDLSEGCHCEGAGRNGRPVLGETKMMGVRRTPAAYRARLLRHKLDVFAITNAARFR